MVQFTPLRVLSATVGSCADLLARSSGELVYGILHWRSDSKGHDFNEGKASFGGTVFLVANSRIASILTYFDTGQSERSKSCNAQPNFLSAGVPGDDEDHGCFAAIARWRCCKWSTQGETRQRSAGSISRVPKCEKTYPKLIPQRILQSKSKDAP